MRKNIMIIFLVLFISVFIPILSGCKGGSSSSTEVSPSSSSSAAKAPSAAANKLSPGLWKMTVKSTTQMPSIAGRPPMNRSSINTVTECIKPDSKKTKPYIMKPSNFNCTNIKEHMDADGSVHWSMQCKNPTGTFSGKGVTKISADSFTSHSTMTETTKSGFSMKSVIDDTGKLISAKCPAKS